MQASMATKRCYYEVLSVARTASDKEIVASYRRLAVRFHPDSNDDDPDAAEKFKEAAEAYEVLSDAQKRVRYDQFGHAGLQGGAAAGRADPADIFGDLFGGIFGDVFGGGGRRRRQGEDVQCEVTLDLEEAAAGVEKEITLRRDRECKVCLGDGSKPGSRPQSCARCGGVGQVAQSMGFVRVRATCPSCGGKGQVITDPCGDCRGNGFVNARVKLGVTIPAGIDDGMQVVTQGAGQPSRAGGPPGDLYCLVRVRPHRLFQREGQHLVLKLPITFTQAALGAMIEVPTLDGRHDLEVPSGTQSGEVFRVAGQGLHDPREPHRRRGDLAVQTVIEVPKTLTQRQEELLRELAELERANVTPHRKSFLETVFQYFSPSEDESPTE